MSERRVVITGVGVVTPVGNDLQTFWQSLLAGKSGIGLVTRFDTTRFDCKIGGEVKDFKPEQFMPAKETRRTDRFTQYAVAAARMAVRLGAREVRLVYRRTEVEMPARVEEVAHAKEEGVIFHLLQNAKRILGDENDCVKGIECLRYELGAPDASGRRSPVEIKGSEFVMEADTIIVAIGNESNPLIKQTTSGLATDKWGHITVDENGKTSLDRVYAGGDIVTGAATVIEAMGMAKKASDSIIKRLLTKKDRAKN